MRRLLLLAIALAALAQPAHAAVDETRLRLLVGDWEHFKDLRAMGPDILPVLARMYEEAGPEDRATIAATFYRLGWLSPDAKRVLMRDVHTQHPDLRLQVQWALGKVSADDDVIEVLLANMQHDDNPLFRDKAACALAHDQAHITPEQQLRLLEGVVEALADEKLQVRKIALQVLRIQTGQAKGFVPDGPPEQRARVLEVWRRWIAEYRANL